MAKLLISYLLLILTCAFAEAQPPISKNANSLYQLLSKSKPDTSRVNLLIKIGRFDNAHSAQQPALPDSALAVAGRANTLSEKLGYTEGVGLSYQIMAQAFCNKKNFKKSDDLIAKAIGVFLTHELFRDAAEAYLNKEEFYLSAGGHDYKVMIRYYEQAQTLFHKANALEREGATLERLGDFYQVIDDLDKSLVNLNQALIVFKQVKYPCLQYTYDLLNSVNMRKSRYREALKYGLLAERIAHAVNDTSLLLCTIYTRIGTTYFVINKSYQSEIYFKNALKIARKYGDRPSIRIVLQSLIAAYAAEHKYKQALELIKQIRKQYFSANNEEIILDYADFILIYTGLTDYHLAQVYSDKLLKSNFLSLGSSTTVYALNSLTGYLVQSGQYERAAEYVPIFRRLAIRLAMKRKEYQAYLMGFKTDSAKGNYLSAINNYRRYFFLKDSLYDITKTGQLEELKIQYETEQKEQSITILKRNTVLQKDNLERADIIRNITIAASIILVVFILLLYKSYRVNKQNSVAIDKKNQTLSELLTEKEWLLKEIHHRVKNNLQIVTGLLQRQSAYINNHEALEAIQNSENRMHAIALIHQKLYQSESLDLISMPEYIEEMISYLKDSCSLHNRIVFEKHLEAISLDVAQAVPLGLILNEAVTNAIKYAYKDNESGTIYITLVKSEDDTNQLTIADNGPGFPESFDYNEVDSLGLNLMRGLCKQLGATLEFINEQGCTINIIFKTQFFSKTADRG
ncbi:histidine kinase dimerization/phosphoacceptor domain -containing protein [Mucilaginibacter sp. AW1-7]|uniref:sensor histidine kinase n=1 Tax=Mucilaginibacter sp. AW1-7 TaxID=3349874 RepID=UPI003F7344E0